MMKQISYYLMNPTKNMTILVETPVPEASFPFVAQKLMELEPEAEQVGFVGTSSGLHAGGMTEVNAASGKGMDGRSLRMAGGEFCGNASMSAAVYYAMQEGISEGVIWLQVSGASEAVEVQVEKHRECDGTDSVRPDETWYGRVHMPKPVSVAEETFPDGSVHTVVRFEGIAHVIMEEADAGHALVGVSVSSERVELLDSVEALKQNPDLALKMAASWCEHLNVDAIGLMFLNASHDKMWPLVYVPAAGTCIWESSCASGTTAAGAYLARQAAVGFAQKTEVSRYRLRQPGGTLEIDVTPDGEYYLAGQVKVQRRREVELDVAE